MPILTCPTCGSKLEVADEDIGHTVQCGSCQQTFKAEDPAETKNDGAARDPGEDADRPSRRRRRDADEDADRPSRRRRDDEDEDDLDADYRPRRRRSRYRDEDAEFEDRYGPQQQTGMGIASLVLGILSIPLNFCYLVGVPLGILAIVFGILSLKTAGRGMGIAGIITGALSFLIIAAVVIFYIVLFAAAGAPGGGPGGGGGGGRF